MSSQTRPVSGWLGVSWIGWLKAAALIATFALLYLPNLLRLWQKTNLVSGDSNWSHSITIPLVGLYYLFLHREQLMSTPLEPILGDRFTRMRVYEALAVMAGGGLMYLLSPMIRFGDSTISFAGLTQNAAIGVMALGVFGLVLDWGLGTLLAGLLLSAYGIFPGQNDFVWDMGMILTLFGTVLTLCGWKVMRITWFPIVFLVCAIPWPPLVYSQIAMPLQSLAAIASVGIMNLFGIDASYGGTKIFMPQYDPDTGLQLADRALNVAEACAGMVALMTFISIGTAVAFLSIRPMWQRAIIIASAIPIAIMCNVARVAGVGILDLWLGREWSEGFAHKFAGMVLMLPAFLMIMLVCWIVDHIFIEEAELPARPPASSPAGSPASPPAEPTGGIA
ncbi:MAG: exosortase/archaeosortase family protein [Burkholderiales bacterium]|nr:exosortase/archaeosortase family protein [Phycisphaerae bacterium]